MKNLSFLLALMLSSLLGISQDTIVKVNGEIIKSKVLEVNTGDVKYKLYDNANGPVYVIAKRDISLIKYENGYKDIFTDENNRTEAAPGNTNATGEDRIITKVGRYYVMDGKVINENDLRGTLAICKNQEGYKVYMFGVMAKNIGSPCNVIGTIGFSLGSLILYAGSQSTNAKSVNKFNTIGGVLAGAGFIFMAGGILLKIKGYSNMNRAVDIYNSSIKTTGYINDIRLNIGMTQSGPGCGVSLRF